MSGSASGTGGSAPTKGQNLSIRIKTKAQTGRKSNRRRTVGNYGLSLKASSDPQTQSQSLIKKGGFAKSGPGPPRPPSPVQRRNAVEVRVFQDLRANTTADQYSKLLKQLNLPDIESLTQPLLEDKFLPSPSIPRSDSEFEDRYKGLKISAWQWAKTHFSHATAKTFDLLPMAEQHPHLMEFINYIASCHRDEDWDHFVNHHRVLLAFAVLGKLLEVHVFNHEMFGATDPQVEALRSLDLQMLHLDGTPTSPFLPSPNN